MLETTILKVTHYGTSQVKKLLPYIQKADVYSAELANCSEQKAESQEGGWKYLLSSGMTSFRFIEKMREVLEEIEPSKDRLNYALLEREYLFRNKVPIWFTERFSVEESKKIIEMEKDADVYRKTARMSLLDGDVAGYLSYQWESFKLMRESDVNRDREIARNIDNAEEKLKEKYPSLPLDKKVHFVVSIGCIHSPEKYTKSQVKVCDISAVANSLDERIYRTLATGKGLEELKQLMLASELQRLARLVRIPLKEKQIMAMGFEQLVGEINKISKRL